MNSIMYNMTADRLYYLYTTHTIIISSNHNVTTVSETNASAAANKVKLILKLIKFRLATVFILIIMIIEMIIIIILLIIVHSDLHWCLYVKSRPSLYMLSFCYPLQCLSS